MRLPASLANLAERFGYEFGGISVSMPVVGIREPVADIAEAERTK